MGNTQNISLDALQHLSRFIETMNSAPSEPVVKYDPEYINPFAAHLMNKAEQPVYTRSGRLLSKSEIDEITLDYTTTRSLTEEAADRMIRYIYDRTGYFDLFGSRIVNKLTVPTRRRRITRKNLVSNEQAGRNVISNNRIIQHFRTDLHLKNAHLHFQLPLQTIVDNLYERDFEAKVMDDITISLGNDILDIVINGLEKESYRTAPTFYNLNRGFVYSLQVANGENTNSHDPNFKIYGDAAKIMTPNKVDAAGAAGANWTAANLIALMRKMYQLMPTDYRKNKNNKWVLGSKDYDLYVESRSNMDYSSNTFREGVLNTGLAPNFMGHEVTMLPLMASIDETHEEDADVPGMIIFGDLKDIEVAASAKDMVRHIAFDPEGNEGAVYKYNFHTYFDVQVVTPESFVIAYVGAKAFTPYLVTPEGAKTGHTGKIADTDGTYTQSDGEDFEGVIYCDNSNVTIVQANATLASADTLSAAKGVTGAKVVHQGEVIKIDENGSKYFRAYSNDLEPSDMITVTVSNISD